MQRPRSTRFGRYELLGQIGRGGMAELHVARMRGVAGFTKQLAIKRMLPQLCDDVRFVEMFLNEARIAARLSHPNVCQVFELGEVEGRLFIAMEYLDGLSWAQLARVEMAPRDHVRCIAGVMVQACEGLGYAHELTDDNGRATPVIHRDVSPQNLFVTVDGICKLLDFGVSKMMTDHTLTQTGVVKGKLPYMSPEQIQNEPLDARSDVWAVGVVLWEALTRRRLFARPNDYRMLRAITEEPIDPPSAHATHVSEALDRVVLRALERDLVRRPPSMAALADELRRATMAYGGAASREELARVVRAHRTMLAHVATDEMAETTTMEPARSGTETGPSATAPTMQLRAASTATRPAPPRRPRRWPLAAGVLAVAAAAVTAGVALVGEPRVNVTPVASASELATPPAEPPPMRALATPPRIEPAPAEQPRAEPPPVRASTPPAPSSPTSSAERSTTKPTRARRVAPTPIAAPAPGFFSIDSVPYATIYIDGARRDQTPLYRVPLAPGRHQIRAVLAGGRERRFVIHIEQGKEISSGTLAW